MIRCEQCKEPVPPPLQKCPACHHPLPAHLLRGQDTLLGREIGGYQLLDKLGEGGMARIYLARHLEEGGEYALKLIREKTKNHKQALQRFDREIRLTRRVSQHSPHIVQIYDFGYAEELGYYYTMEHLSGQNLAELLDYGGIDLPRAFDITFQVLDALGAVHQEGIVHRDLKPENIFLADGFAYPEFVKMLDFGIAKPLAEHQTIQTAYGQIFGTPEYMSPEQCRGPTQEQAEQGELYLDARADIYAVGTIFYELLCGRVPFPRDPALGNMGVLMVLNHHLNTAPPSLVEAYPEKKFPLEVDHLLRRTLAKDPNDRPANIEEMKQTLLEITSRHNIPTRGAAKEAAAEDSHVWNRTQQYLPSFSASEEPPKTSPLPAQNSPSPPRESGQAAREKEEAFSTLLMDTSPVEDPAAAPPQEASFAPMAQPPQEAPTDPQLPSTDHPPEPFSSNDDSLAQSSSAHASSGRASSGRYATTNPHLPPAEEEPLPPADTMQIETIPVESEEERPPPQQPLHSNPSPKTMQAGQDLQKKNDSAAPDSRGGLWLVLVLGGAGLLLLVLTALLKLFGVF